MTSAQEGNAFYRGCTAVELARLFEIPVSTVRDNLSKVYPCGKRGNVDLFHVKDAAKWLLPLEDDELVGRILRMNHNALPKMLAKEYWAGQLNKIKVEREMGDLWPTDGVVQRLSEAYKEIRLSLMLLIESVDREDELTERQRKIIITAVDSTLNDAADRLVNAFENRREHALDEASPPIEDGETAEL